MQLKSLKDKALPYLKQTANTVLQKLGVQIEESPAEVCIYTGEVDKPGFWTLSYQDQIVLRVGWDEGSLRLSWGEQDRIFRHREEEIAELRALWDTETPETMAELQARMTEGLGVRGRSDPESSLDITRNKDIQQQNERVKQRRIDCVSLPVNIAPAKDVAEAIQMANSSEWKWVTLFAGRDNAPEFVDERGNKHKVYITLMETSKFIAPNWRDSLPTAPTALEGIQGSEVVPEISTKEESAS